MRFDVRAFARQHRYRVRNLHDGRPVPPVRAKGRVEQSAAFIGPTERDDAIMCKCGYVCGGDGRIDWALLCASARGHNPRLAALRALPGVLVAQSGDAESAGTAPAAAVDSVLGVLQPFRRRPPSPGASADRMAAIRPRTGCVGAALTDPEATRPRREGVPVRADDSGACNGLPGGPGGRDLSNGIDSR